MDKAKKLQLNKESLRILNSDAVNGVQAAGWHQSDSCGICGGSITSNLQFSCGASCTDTDLTQ